ncbi:hypothetical protein V6N11_049117 [Hibiscus sabdariffa]|uniref:Uncharacterized protein n=1 Tax=Hibiscus sabdariffa TaxID=183260 RepID=A0ABR2PXU4_9ROSI
MRNGGLQKPVGTALMSMDLFLRRLVWVLFEVSYLTTKSDSINVVELITDYAASSSPFPLVRAIARLHNHGWQTSYTVTTLASGTSFPVATIAAFVGKTPHRLALLVAFVMKTPHIPSNNFHNSVNNSKWKNQRSQSVDRIEKDENDKIHQRDLPRFGCSPVGVLPFNKQLRTSKTLSPDGTLIHIQVGAATKAVR